MWSVVNAALSGPELLSKAEADSLPVEALAQLATQRAADRVRGKTFSGEPIAVRVWETNSDWPIFFGQNVSAVLEGSEGELLITRRLQVLAERLTGHRCPDTVSLPRLRQVIDEEHCFRSEHFCILSCCGDTNCCPQRALIGTSEPPVLHDLLRQARLFLQPFPSGERTGYLGEEEIILDQSFLDTFSPQELQAPSLQLKALLKANPTPSAQDLEKLADMCCFRDSPDWRLHRARLEFLEHAKAEVALVAARSQDKARKDQDRRTDLLSWNKKEILCALNTLAIPTPARLTRIPLLSLLVESKLQMASSGLLTLTEPESASLHQAQLDIAKHKIAEEAKRQTQLLSPAYQLTKSELVSQLKALGVPAGDLKQKLKPDLVRLFEQVSLRK